MKDNAKFVEEIQKITKERMMLKDSYEKCCNDPGLSVKEKEVMLNNFEVAYGSLELARDRLLDHHMKGE